MVLVVDGGGSDVGGVGGVSCGCGGGIGFHDGNYGTDMLVL